MQVQFEDHPTDPDKVILRKRGREAPVWIGLTDEEVNYLLEHTDWFEWPHLFAKAVESKLKEKNAGV
jgi:hypothetical protein